MSMKQINEDLGYTYEEKYGKSEPGSPEDDETVHYPRFEYDDDEALDIPSKGKMLIEFEEVERTESTRDGKKHFHCVIAVKKIISVDGPKDERPAKSDTSASDALDRIAEALEKAQGGDEEEDEDEEGY